MGDLSTERTRERRLERLPTTKSWLQRLEKATSFISRIGMIV